MSRWALLLLLLLGGCNGCVSVPTHNDLRATALTLRFANGARCSGTAIARDVLVTAQHCLGAPLALVNGKPVKVIGIGKDSKDLATIRITGLRFSAWARIGAPLAQGDRVRWFGAPGGDEDMYREGYVVRARTDMILLDARSYSGDSGAGVFNARGQLVGVVSGGVIWISGKPVKVEPTDFISMQLVYIFPMDRR